MSKELPGHARIVIVGGGVVGSSIAYQLTKAGEKDVVLLERGVLSCGTSWHAAGLIMQLRGGHATTDVAKYNAEFYPELERDTGIATGFKQNGTLAIGRNIPLPEIIAWLISLAPQGVIEFVEKEDPMIGRMLQLRDDIFTDYSRDAFLAAIGDHAEIVDTCEVIKGRRLLVWYRRPR